MINRPVYTDNLREVDKFSLENSLRFYSTHRQYLEEDKTQFSVQLQISTGLSGSFGVSKINVDEI